MSEVEISQQQSRIVGELTSIKDATRIFYSFIDFLKSVEIHRRDKIFALCLDYLTLSLSRSLISQKEKEGIQQACQILRDRPTFINENEQWRKRFIDCLIECNMFSLIINVCVK